AERGVRVGYRVVEAGTAADHEVLLLGDVVGEADARCHIVVVAQAGLIQGPARSDAGGVDRRTPGRIERGRLVDKRRIDRAQVVVPADAAVEGEPVARRPG